MKKEKTAQNSNLAELMQAAENEMRRLNYSHSSIRHRWEVWGKYLKSTASPSLDPQEWQTFLRLNYGIESLDGKLTRHQRAAREAMQSLFQFAKEGCLDNWSLVRSDPEVIPEEFCQVVNGFILQLKKRNCAYSTIGDYTRTFRRLTKFLKREGVASFSDLTPEHISPFIATVATYHGRSVGALLSELRQIFRFLYLNKYHDKDLSLFIPKSNVLRSREHLPSIWSKDDVRKMLENVDVGSPTGKRDYAMILLVSQLGLRVSDIVNLKFENIKWEKNCIEISQHKTKEPLSLPLYEDTGSAVIDYLKHGRPKTDSKNIFIRHQPPFIRFDENNRLHSMLNRYIYRAGIEITPEKSHGMHSLRHSLATDLVRRGVDLPTVSKILGHKRLETTTNYVRMDIEDLRDCALSLEV